MAFYEDIPKEDRIRSYDFIESFIANSVPDWSQWNVSIGTDEIESSFSNTIHNMEQKKFEFLLLHCGYIPDYYGKDSSQETLYSKLVESMVCEWAKRVGFTESFLQKQKSNKEDITIKTGDKVIVCDAKSFRLGRSQAAPNVKDVIKREAYTSWLADYDEANRIGGLTTFPSAHNWKKGGEAYAYYTKKNPPIMFLFYEHLSFILNQGITAVKIIDVLNSYGTIFPHSSKEQSVYWNGIIGSLFADNDNFAPYMLECGDYIKEKIEHTKDLLNDKLRIIAEDINNHVDSLNHEDLLKEAKDAIFENRAKELKVLLDNINKFR